MRKLYKIFCRKASVNKNFASLSGFSQIELLAIISIISILIAIIVPIVSAVRNSAKKTQSLSNLRQLAAAINMYAADNKGFYPIGYYTSIYTSTASDDERYWYLEIAPYLDQNTVANDANNSVLISPFAEGEVDSGDFDGSVKSSPSTYSVHGILCPDVSPRDDIPGHSPTSRFITWNLKEKPHEIILVGESAITQAGDGVPSHAVGTASATFYNPNAWQDPYVGTSLEDIVDADEANGKLSYRANGSTLVAFVDGSVGEFKKGTVKYKNIAISTQSVY